MIPTESPTDILGYACKQAGVDASDAKPLHDHATSVFLLAQAGVVARVSSDPETVASSSRTVTLVHWLVEQGFPAPAPAQLAQPVTTGGYVVTFWRYYPQHDWPAPQPAELGNMLRKLHGMADPPVVLPSYRPLHTLGAIAEATTAMSEDDKEWLQQRRTELLKEFHLLDSPLGHGFIHGDAYPGNMIWDGPRALLSDWDEAATGPRELDLVNTHQGARFGRSREARDAFTAAYGHDVTTWPGFPVLREMRDLHTLGSYIRRADRGSDLAATELRHRLDTLRRADGDARWHAR